MVMSEMKYGTKNAPPPFLYLRAWLPVISAFVDGGSAARV